MNTLLVHYSVLWNREVWGMVLGFLGLKNNKPQCKKLFISVWWQMENFMFDISRWCTMTTRSPTTISQKFWRMRFLQNEFLKVFCWICQILRLCEKYKIFILRNTHSSRGLSRNVKVVRLCLRNIKSSTYVKHTHCSRILNETSSSEVVFEEYKW